MSANDPAKSRVEREDLCLVLSAILGDTSLWADDVLLEKRLGPSRDQFVDLEKPREIYVRDLFPLRVERGGRIIVGGGGVIVQCVNNKQPAIKYALKIPRPSLFGGDSQSVEWNIRDAAQEYLKHAPLSHENVARVLGPGKIDIRERSGREVVFSVILMEWIDGAVPLNRYLAQEEVDFRAVLDILTQCFKGLAYIHDQALIHWDIKSDNLLVSESGVVKLTDIGNARYVKNPARGDLVYSTRGNPPLPPRGHSTERKTETSRRVAYKLPSLEWDCPWLDMWMLARELNRIFKAKLKLYDMDCEEQAFPGDIQSRADQFLEKFPSRDDNATFALAFVRLIVNRLLRPNGPDKPKCYDTADAVVQDLAKVLPEFGGAQAVPELRAIPQRVLRLPQSGNAPWTERVNHVFNSSAVQRLRRHKQLGAVSQVYPGANHVRLEHVAGVLAATTDYVRALYSHRSDPFWRLTIDSKDIDALLLAAMLHDVGHLAFGHYLEEMEGMVKGRTHVDYAILLLHPDHGDSDVRFGSDSRIAAETDRRAIRELVCLDWAKEQVADAFLRRVAEILRPSKKSARAEQDDDAPVLYPAESEQIKVNILHSILDSAVDADKLDYLLLDAHHCGVRYPEGIDTDRFFQSLTAVPFFPGFESHEPPQASIAVTEKGVLPVESMLIARYQMFSCVYWHHTTRALTAMLQFLVLTFLGTDTERVDQRLDELLGNFRELDDESALIWLKEKLTDNPGISEQTRTFLQSIADGLLGLDRKLVYWPGFELQYDPIPQSATRRVYDGLMRESINAGNAGNPADYVKAICDLRGSFVEKFRDSVRRGFREELGFVDGEILIDIPPAGKDQVKNVFISEAGWIKPIEDLSPLSGAVSDAFRYWVRKPRVFLSPSAWKKCGSAKLTADDVSKLCLSCLEEMFIKQKKLPLGKVG